MLSKFSLSKPHPEFVVQVSWSTEAIGTATAGEDYTAAGGRLVFEVGETTKTISIPLLDDSVSEGVETFHLRLSGVSRATLVSVGPVESLSVMGTILPDEDTDAPTVTVRTQIPVTPPVSGPINILVEFSEAVTGLELSELEVTNGFGASISGIGATKWSRQWRVDIVPDEGLTGNISIRVPAGVATDALGNSNTASEPFVIAARGHGSGHSVGPKAWLRCLGSSDPASWAPYTKVVSVEYGLTEFFPGRVNSGAISLTNVDGVDAGAGLAVCTGPGPGLCNTRIGIRDGMTGQLTLQVLAGAATFDYPEPNTLSRPYTLSRPSDPMLVTGYGWAVSVADGSATEGTDETIDFEVRLNAQDDCKAVKVDWAVTDGTATAGEDYTAVSGTLTFNPGETVKTISIPVLEDDAADGEETLTLTLSNPAGVELTDSEAIGTIKDEERVAALTARFENVPESHDGSTAFTFELHFSEEPDGITATLVRENLFDVTGATITSAQQLTEGSNQAWTVTATPSGTDDIAISGQAAAAGTSATVPIVAVPEAPPALTATLESVPESHDGSTAFTFELHFSENIPGLSYKTVGGPLLDVTGANVNGARRLTAGSNQDWLVTVAPSGSDDISITLPARACGETAAICIADNRPLSEGISATVQMEPQAAQPSGGALTARFANVPESHDGLTAFTVELHFSENIPGLSYKTVGGGLLDATGANVTGARRLTAGSNQGWLVTVAPSVDADVTLTVPGTDDCAAPNAICVGDDRKLEAGASATITVTPIAVTVADTEVEEAEGATLDFVVSMNRASARDIQISYRAYDGTATAGADYVAVYSSFTMTAGETTKTVSVSVLDDAHDEGAETVKFWLTGVRGLRASQITDPYAVGTITNSDPMPKAWITRFGRTVGSQVVDAVTARFEGGTSAHVTVGGMSLDGTSLAGADPSRWPEWASESEQRGGTRTMTERELLLGSSFHLSAGGDASGGPAFAAWGRVATGGFEADVDDVRMDGDMTTGLIGLDAEWDRVLAGLLLSQSKGDGSYTLSEEMGDDRGTVESTMTGVYPYARLEISERVSAWGLAGLGSGEFTLNQEGQAPIKTDLGMRMGAVGLKGTVLDGSGPSGVGLSVKSDAMWVRTESDRTVGLESAEGDVSRLRLIVEGERVFEAGDGATFTPTGQVGLRLDGGDAETGSGVEVGGGLRYIAGPLTIEGQVRMLVAHEESGYEEWGASGAIRMTPSASGRGLTLSIAPAWGRTGSATERLWSAHDARGLGADSEFEAGGQLAMDAGYGVGLPGNRGVLTPYAGVTLGDAGARTMRTGARWQLSPDVVVGLEATRQASDASAGANEVRLRAALRF